MANTATYTNTTALAKAIELIADCGDKELLDKLVHMLNQSSKPSSKASGPTKAQIKNKHLAKQVAMFVWNSPDSVSSKDVIAGAGCPDVIGVPKVSALMKIAAAEGWVRKLQTKSGVLYGMGDVDPR